MDGSDFRGIMDRERGGLTYFQGERSVEGAFPSIGKLLKKQVVTTFDLTRRTFSSNVCFHLTGVI